MNEIKRIAAVHDISGFGKCSLTVALPVISASGVECSVLPTALLSTHTGGFTNFTFRDLSDEMLPIARHWKSVGVEFDGIYSGYLANSAQAELLRDVVNIISTDRTKIIVDPVMADNGSYYQGFGEDMCAAFRGLCAGADIITPNITEAALLTGIPYHSGPHSGEYIDSLINGLSRLCSGVIALTGVCTHEGNVGAVSVDVKSGKRHLSLRPIREGTFHGTGDIFASAFSALIIRGAALEDATELSISLVSDSIDRTAKRGTPSRNGVDFENALPGYITKVSQLFGE